MLTMFKVRIAAMEAFAAMFRSIPKKFQTKFFSLMPAVLNILPPLKDSSESEELSSAFIALIELAEISPKMFKSSFSDLVKFSISVIADKELSDQVRQNALELMATFADYAPNMCKKEANFAQEMVTQCLSLMTDVGADDDDAEEWNASEDVSLLTPLGSIISLTALSSNPKRATSTTLLVSSVWTASPTNWVVKPSSSLLFRGFPV